MWFRRKCENRRQILSLVYNLRAILVLVFGQPDIGLINCFSFCGKIIRIRSCRRAAATICPRPSSPWVPKRLARPSRLQRSISFPRPTRSHAHCCCCLTRQHGGEQSGLGTLKVVSGSRVTSLTWATSVPILVFLHLSVLDLDPMYATDRQTGQTRIIAYRCVCYA